MGIYRRAAGKITLAAAVAVVLLAALPASSALGSVSFVASNNQASATGVTYTITFQVGVLDKGFAVVLPTGVTGLSTTNVTIQTSSDGTSFSAPALAGVNPKLISADGQRVGVNLASAVALNTWVKVTITGLTNPASTGDYTITVGGKTTDLLQTDLDAALATLLGLLAETANMVLSVVAVVTNGITNNVTVAPSLTFSVGAASHSWSLDPAGTATSTTVTDALTMATNAGTYQIQALISGNLVRAGTAGASASDYIPYNGAQSGPHFGYTVTGPAGDTVDSAAFRTFSTTATNLVGGWSLSGLTNSETTTVTYDVKIDYTKAPGTYVGTITYRIVPTY